VDGIEFGGPHFYKYLDNNLKFMHPTASNIHMRNSADKCINRIINHINNPRTPVSEFSLELESVMYLNLMVLNRVTAVSTVNILILLSVLPYQSSANDSRKSAELCTSGTILGTGPATARTTTRS
jgi:hypothetical protein